MNLEQYEVKIHSSIKQISKKEWEHLLGDITNPFFSWNWLFNLEDSSSISRETGWYPLYFVVEFNNEIIAIAPLFLKNHSYGEFIFDQPFARLAAELNLEYYPKLIGMSPYSPVEGYQFLYRKNSNKLKLTGLLIKAIDNFALNNNILSCNFLYVDMEWSKYLNKLGYHKWMNIRSEWKSNEEKTFDEFLKRFNSNQRKNIKKERKSIDDLKINIEVLKDEAINNVILKKMHNFYAQHCSRWGIWGSKYLTSKFFDSLLKEKEKVLIFKAQKESSLEILAMSMCISNENYLWGRYWGCKEELKNLHFELCYYQPIEWAIANGIKSFDPGAGGNHKRRRGFYARQTISSHKWFNNNMEIIMKDWLNKVNKETIYEIDLENNSIPFIK